MRAFLIVIMMVIAGCSSQLFSAQALSKVDASMSGVRVNPATFRGSNVMAGGVIADLRNGTEGGELEVEELPLDVHGKPKIAYPVKGSGKFILISKDRLDPAIYRKGLPVSVIAEVAGARASGPKESQTMIPLLAIRELRLWTGR